MLIVMQGQTMPAKDRPTPSLALTKREEAVQGPLCSITTEIRDLRLPESGPFEAACPMLATLEGHGGRSV